MKYKLIKKINPQYNAIQQILTNRGIDFNEIHHYLNTTDKDINDAEALGSQLLKDAAAALIQTIQNEEDAVVIVDCDCDGYTSAAIIINYLYDLFPA
jgi:single-stranded DNA-specific DHH superfamily exonuclease